MSYPKEKTEKRTGGMQRRQESETWSKNDRNFGNVLSVALLMNTSRINLKPPCPAHAISTALLSLVQFSAHITLPAGTSLDQNPAAKKIPKAIPLPCTVLAWGRISDSSSEGGLLGKDTLRNLKEFTWGRATANSSRIRPKFKKGCLSAILYVWNISG